jgi:putative Holliday junction resolvase
VRVLALDIGEKRIGVAVSDPDATLASALTVLDTARMLGGGTELARILQDYDDIGLIVAGLPVSLDGSQGPQAARVSAVAQRIAEQAGLPLEFVDERLSSVEAERRMAEAGLDARQRRGSVDKVAACIMLQSYLDARKGGRDGTETE